MARWPLPTISGVSSDMILFSTALNCAVVWKWAEIILWRKCSLTIHGICNVNVPQDFNICIIAGVKEWYWGRQNYGVHILGLRQEDAVAFGDVGTPLCPRLWARVCCCSGKIREKYAGENMLWNTLPCQGTVLTGKRGCICRVCEGRLSW